MTKVNPISKKPLINEEGTICHFGQCLEAGEDTSLFDIAPEILREMVDEHQLLVLRGFSPLHSQEQLTSFCKKLGNIMMWPFGPILELI